ncbi:hypothetical protein C4K02_2144 [Pseudomonas synxantha]|nr:hypothetical protein C4K02_2144 [Pseudomonas synxantha]
MSLNRCFKRYRFLYLRRLDEGAFCLRQPKGGEQADSQGYADAA